MNNTQFLLKCKLHYYEEIFFPNPLDYRSTCLKCIERADKRTVIVYMIYDGSGTQNNKANYLAWLEHPGLVSGDSVLYWFKITDDDGEISTREFNEDFEAFDYENDSQNTLNDEVEIDVRLKKMEDV